MSVAPLMFWLTDSWTAPMKGSCTKTTRGAKATANHPGLLPAGFTLRGREFDVVQLVVAPVNKVDWPALAVHQHVVDLGSHADRFAIDTDELIALL